MSYETTYIRMGLSQMTSTMLCVGYREFLCTTGGSVINTDTEKYGLNLNGITLPAEFIEEMKVFQTTGINPIVHLE